jgi:hypothetical protein
MDFPRFSRKAVNRLLRFMNAPREGDGSIYVANRKSILRFLASAWLSNFLNPNNRNIGQPPGSIY